MCDLPPPDSRGGQYLSYSSGTLPRWAAQLLGAEPHLPLPSSPCSALTAAGMFAMGAAPAPALWMVGTVVAGLVLAEGATSAYDGVAADPYLCGAASGNDGALMLFGWRLPASFYLP